MQFRSYYKSSSSMSPSLRRSISPFSFYFTIMFYPSKLIARRARAYIPRHNVHSERGRERGREGEGGGERERETIHRGTSVTVFAQICMNSVHAKREGEEKREGKTERKTENARGETVNGLTRWIAIKLTVERNSWIISGGSNTL